MENENVTSSFNDLEEVSIILGMSSTKTVNDGLDTHWAEGDMVMVNVGNGGTYFNSVFTRYADNDFKGLAPAQTGGMDWYVTYPKPAAISDPDVATVTIGQTLVQNGNNSMAHIAGAGFPLYGFTKNVAQGTVPVVQMHNIASVLRFDVINTETAPITVKSIDFIAPSGEAISGSFTGDITADEIQWAPVPDKTSDRVTLTVMDAEPIEVGGSASFYVGTMPLSTNDEFTIRVKVLKDGFECIHEKHYDTPIQTPAGMVTKVSFNFERTKYQQIFERVTSDPADGDWTGKYLIVSTDENRQYVCDYTAERILDGTSASNAGAGYYLNPAIRHSDDLDLTFKGNDRVYVMSDNAKVSQYLFTIVNTGNNHVASGITGYLAHTLQNSSGQYIAYSSGKIRCADSPRVVPANVYDYNIVLDYNETSKCVEIRSAGMSSGNTKYYLQWSKVDGLWNFRFNTSLTANSGQGVHLYKLVNLQDGIQVSPQNFNLENVWVKSYLDAANNPENSNHYTNDNVRTKTIVSTYRADNNWPAPVSLSLPPVTGGTERTIIVSEDSSFSTVDASVTVTGNIATVYNLIPGRKYYYKIDGQDFMDSFTTEGRVRMIKVAEYDKSDRATNVRDLGGLRTVAGKTVKYGKIYRGSNIDASTSEDNAVLIGTLGIGLDLDLRCTGTGSAGTAVLDENVVDYVNPGWGSWINSTNANRLTTEKIYETFNSIISTLKKGKAVYIHSNYGSDRTGFIAWLLELAIGVTDMDCSIDYEMSSFARCGNRTRSGSSTYFPDFYNHIKNYTKGTTMQEKAVNILLDAGITAGQISDLRYIMIGERDVNAGDLQPYERIEF